MCNHKKINIRLSQRSLKTFFVNSRIDIDEELEELAREMLEAQVPMINTVSCQNMQVFNSINYAFLSFYSNVHCDRFMEILFQPIQDNLPENILFDDKLFDRGVTTLTSTNNLVGSWQISSGLVYGNSYFGQTISRGRRHRSINLNSSISHASLLFPASDIPILVERMKMFNEWFKHRDLDDDLLEWNPKTSFEIEKGVLRVR
jgi:hypothetical protein